MRLEEYRAFFALSLSQRQEIADWVEVPRANALESDMQYFRRVLAVAASKNMLDELVRRAARAASGA